MMRKMKVLLFTFMLLTLAFTAHAQSITNQQIENQPPFKVELGSDFQQLVKAVPDIKPVASEMFGDDTSVYYSLAPQKIYGLTPIAVSYYFNEDKLFEVKYDFGTASKVTAKRLLQGMHAVHGETDLALPEYFIFDDDSPYVGVSGIYRWPENEIDREYEYKYVEDYDAGHLSVRLIQLSMLPKIYDVE